MEFGQFLLFVIALFPTLCWLSLRFFRYFEGFYNFAYCLFPILYLVNLMQASKYLSNESSNYTMLEAMQGVSMAIYADKLSVIFTFVLGFVWFVFAFYSVKYLKISNYKNSNVIQEYFVLIVSFLNLLILSKNLFTILFFYNCLIISSHFFGARYLNFVETKFTKFFTAILYIESFFIFIATVLAFKINNQIEFVEKIILPTNYNQFYHLIIFLLFFMGLFFSMIVPFYLFFKNIKFDSLVLMVLFLLSYGFSSVFLFLKILNYIYGVKGLALIIKLYGLRIFEIIFLINLIISSIYSLREKIFKSSLFYIFVNQFIILIYSIIIHASSKFNYAVISLISFIINFIIVFLCSANFELYLNKSTSKSLRGIFRIMPISTIFLLFAFLSLIGLAPSLSMVDKYSIWIFLIKNKMYFSLTLFIVNFLFLAIYTFKNFRQFIFFEEVMSSKGQKEVLTINKKDSDLGKKIDMDSNLILTSLAMVIFSFIGLIFFSYITQFLSFYEPIKS